MISDNIKNAIKFVLEGNDVDSETAFRDALSEKKYAFIERTKKSINERKSEDDGEENNGDNDKHIVVQLRKSISARGEHPVKFKDGSSAKVSMDHAHKALDHISNQQKPDSKDKVTNDLWHSHDSFKKTLGIHEDKVNGDEEKYKAAAHKEKFSHSSYVQHHVLDGETGSINSSHHEYHQAETKSNKLNKAENYDRFYVHSVKRGQKLKEEVDTTINENQSIISTLRHVVASHGESKIVFRDGKAVNIPVSLADQLLRKYSLLQTYGERMSFTRQISKSYESMKGGLNLITDKNNNKNNS